jgi:hypothetical protein
MVLKDLLRVAYNAGRDDVDGFDAWWADEGEDRHEEFLSEGDAQRAIDEQAGTGDDTSDA